MTDNGQIVEVAWESLNRHGEELCGDRVKVTTTPDRLVVALSDGLGSGVKANILATLTTEIATCMLREGVEVDQVVETLMDTLPECQVRHLAYATFAVLQVVEGREAYLVEYDTPPMIMIRQGRQMELQRSVRTIADRSIHECRFDLETGDTLVMLSDGYLHAGAGGLYRMGWGWQNIVTSVRRWVSTSGDAHELKQALSGTSLRLYNGQPGDDATAVCMRIRPRRRATLLTGPPADSGKDREVVERLMAEQGTKIICGGTTAQMAARILNRSLSVDWQPAPGRAGTFPARKLPPAAHLEGTDLVTEGILTLSAAVEILTHASTLHDLPNEQDAGTRLARMLLNADEICFLAGDAINPQQLADVVQGRPMRQVYLDELVALLRQREKQIKVEHW
jgi:hypothetical protein